MFRRMSGLTDVAQINKIIGNDLNVTSDIPYIEFEDYNIDVWSAGTYPTTRLFILITGH